MRLLLLLLLMVSLSVHAGEHYSISEGPTVALAAFSRAAGQPPLQATDQSSVRVWTRDYMLGRVQGFVLSGRTALFCRMSSTYAEGVISLGRASCRPARGRTAAVKAASRLPSFSRPQWDCPLMDGGEVYIEQVQSGQLTAVRVGNPDACGDPESKAIVSFLSELW